MLEREDFAGRWQIDRVIRDALGPEGRFTGMALLVPQGAQGLSYDESGLLRLGDGPEMQATRRYLWQFGGTGVTVRFADGRAFHHFVPESVATGTEHPCGADLYHVTYDFRIWPRWSAQWRVTGPAKDYVMTSIYEREG